MIKTIKLNNGVKIVFENISYVRSAAIGIWVKNGSVNEEAHTAGISHFIEHMFFKGTESRTAKEIAESIDNIGGQINAFTGKEATCYYVKVLDTHVDTGIDVLLDMLFHSKFEDVEIEKEKTVVYEEISMYEDSPDDTVHDLLSQEIFKGHPLGQPVIGNQEAISKFDSKMIKQFVKENYSADSIVISIAGNVDEARCIEEIEARFGHLEPSKDHLPASIPVYQPSFTSKTKDIEQAHICFGTKGYVMDHERYYALSIVNNIMGGSMSSRLFQTIREENGLAYSVYSFMNSYTTDGVYGIYAGVNPNQANEAVDLIFKELKLLKDKGITTDELTKAKEQIKGNYILGLESVSGRMAAIGRHQLLLDKVYTPDEILKSIEEVNMENIWEAIEKITDINQYSGAIVSRDDFDLSSMING